jgi:hypothetical protein
MSRLSRAVARRDMAWKLHSKVANPAPDRQPLSVAAELTSLLRDIPISTIGAPPQGRRPSAEWETIAVVAKIASMTELPGWSVPVGPLHSYFPPTDKEWGEETFRARWTLVKDVPSKTVVDFLTLLIPTPLNWNV